MDRKQLKKKMLSVITGIGLLGATVTGALALENTYPQPFVVNKQFDASTMIIVGDNALASDTLGALDIAASLQKQVQMCTTASGKATLTGDVASFGRSSDLLEVYENLGDVTETFSATDLKGLDSGNIKTSEGSTDYNQYLRFDENDGSIESGRVIFGENENDEVSDFLNFQDGDTIFEYELEFEEGLKSDIQDGTLDDLEDEEVTILGRTYTIVDSDIDVNSNELSLTLLGGSEVVDMQEGESQTFTINGNEYRVEVAVISDSNNEEPQVLFKVNGVVLHEMEEGDTESLEGGAILGVRSILDNEAEDGKDIVYFYIGGHKLEFSDSYNDNEFSTTVDIDEESIEDGSIQVKATENGDELTISTLRYRLNADGEDGSVFIPSGKGLRESLDEPEGMLHDGWDIHYNGINDVEATDVKIESSGDDQYKLKFTNNNGVDYTIDFVSNVNGIKYGSEDDNLFFIEGMIAPASDANVAIYSEVELYTIAEDDYFVVTDDNDETGITNILRYESIDVSNREISFNDEGADDINVIYSGTPGVDANGNIVVGGNTYHFIVGEAPNYKIGVDLNGDGDINGDESNIVVQGGGLLDLGASNTPVNTVQVKMTTLESEMDESNGDEIITVNIDQAGNELDIGQITGIDLFDLENSDNEEGMSRYGVFATKEGDDNEDADDLTLEYPREQRGGDVAISMGATKSTAGGTTCTGEILDIKNALSSEVKAEDISSYNLILVGGPAVNPLSAQFLGVSFPTYGDALNLKVGESIVTMAENGDNVAMLVYGYSAEDTRNAAKSL